MDRILWVFGASFAIAGCTLINDLDAYGGGRAPDASATLDAAFETSTDAIEPPDARPDTVVDAAETAADAVREVDVADALDETAVDSALETGDAEPTVCHPRINELQSGGKESGNDEFVEVVNPCAETISLDGYRLVYRASSNVNVVDGPDTSIMYGFGVGTTLAPGAFVFVANEAGEFAKAPYAPAGTYRSGLAGGGGGVAIRSSSGAIVDAVYYGTPPTTGPHAFIERNPATAPAPGASIGRKPDGADTDDNRADFPRLAASSPGAAN